MNKQQAMNWFDSNFNAGTVTNPDLRDVILEMFNSVEPEKFMPTVGMSYQFSDTFDFLDLYTSVDEFVCYKKEDDFPYETLFGSYKFCRLVPVEMRQKYGE